MRYGRNGLPLPTMDLPNGILQSVNQILKGEHPSLPYGVVPPILSSREELSVPTAERIMMGDKEATRPTKREYGPFVPFVDQPELKSKPKSDLERELDRIRLERKQMLQDKTLIEERRRRRQEIRDMQRE
jgi:hypothetical protein